MTRALTGERDGAAPAERRGTFGQRVRAWLLSVASWVVCRLPEGLVIRLADLAGAIWYRATPQRAAQARRNLARVTAYLAAQGRGSEAVQAAANDPRRLEKLVKAAYRHAARYYVEVMRTPRMSGRTIDERVLVETPEVVEAAFADGRAAMFVAMHFGSVELPALYLARRSGRKVVVPMETLGDPELQRYFVRSRGRVGLRIVGLREARRELKTALERGESVGIVGDRDLTGGGIEVPFFGHPARLPIGPALLAIETGAPLYVVGVRRDGPGRYRGRLQAVSIPAEGDRRTRLTAALTELAGAFEDEIATAPEQWWAAFFPVWDDLDPPKAQASTTPGARPDKAAA